MPCFLSSKMSEILSILNWNCQGIGQKRAEFLQLSTKLRIDIILLNKTHLNPRKTFNLPNFYSYQTDMHSSGASICGGTAILASRTFIHTEIQIPTLSIENTTTHIEFNGHELRISSLFKSPASFLHTTDIDKLLHTTVNTILAGDLNTKNPARNSLVTNTARKTFFTHIKNHNYTIVALESSTHFPDIHRHTPDVLDIAILKTTNFQYSIKKLNNLSSDRNAVILDIIPINRLHRPIPYYSISLQ